MKKILSLALCAAIASSASAASIQWNLSLGRSGFIADSTGAALNGTLYLVLASEADTLSAAAEADTFSATLADIALGSATLASGKNTATQTATSSALTADTSYSFALVVFDSANSQYYFSSALTEKAYDETADIVTARRVTFGTAHVGSTYSGASWAPTTTVPEPATAALALLGVGMLLKRRKA